MNRFFKRQWYEPLFCKCINYFFRSILAVTKKIGYYRHGFVVQRKCIIWDNAIGGKDNRDYPELYNPVFLLDDIDGNTCLQLDAKSVTKALFLKL